MRVRMSENIRAFSRKFSDVRLSSDDSNSTAPARPTSLRCALAPHAKFNIRNNSYIHLPIFDSVEGFVPSETQIVNKWSVGRSRNFGKAGRVLHEGDIGGLEFGWFGWIRTRSSSVSNSKMFEYSNFIRTRTYPYH